MRVVLDVLDIPPRGPHDAPVPPPGSLTFGTYNLHWLKNPEGLRRDMEVLRSVDVWAFQEVRTSDGTDGVQLAAGLSRVLPAGRWHVAVTPLNRLRELRSDDYEAQVVASRYPIRSADVWPLAARAGTKRRAALAAVLDVGGKPDLLFVNVDNEPCLMSPARHNVRQVRSLVEHLDRAGNGLAVLAGDFNTSGCVPRLVSARQDRADLRRTLAAEGFQPAGHAAANTYRSGPYTATLDHVFVRDLPVSRHGVATAATGSDHRPVWCEVRLP